MAYTLALGASARKSVEVQVLSRPQTKQAAIFFGGFVLAEGTWLRDLKAGASRDVNKVNRDERGGVAQILCNKIMRDQVLSRPLDLTFVCSRDKVSIEKF